MKFQRVQIRNSIAAVGYTWSTDLNLCEMVVLSSVAEAL